MAMAGSLKELLSLVGVSAVAILATPSFALAHTAQPQNTAAASADSADENIIVTARNRSEELHDVPAQVTAFSAAQIESRGIEKPADFIASVPNVTFVETQNAGTSFLVIRGISQAR